MTRVDTLDSDKVWDLLKEFENEINWNGNDFIGNSNDVKFALSPSMSTRSIYIKIGDWNGNQTEIRVSDHNPSWKANQKDVYFTFENFDLNTIKRIYNSYI